MNIIRLMICGITLMTASVYSSFTIPTDSTAIAPKSALRNNILSSVSKVPSSKTASTLDAPLKTEFIPHATSLTSQSKVLSKTQEPLVLNDEALLKSSPPTIEEVKMPELQVGPKSTAESSSVDLAKLAKFALPKEETKPITLPKISQDLIVDKQNTEKAPDLQKTKKDEFAENAAENLKSEVLDTSAHEPGVLYQPKNLVDGDLATIAFNFEDASLLNLVSYIESVHNIKFIGEDVISTAKDAKGAVGHKITFRTNRNLTRQESWDLFLTFLHIAGLDVIPLVTEGFYRIVSLAKASKEPIPTYIGVDDALLPDSDMIVRYMYFARNVEPLKIIPMLKNMLGSSAATLDSYAPLKGLIFTDRASSIKSLMRIVKELDKAVLPEALSVVKLQRANADEVAKLYETLTKPAAGATQPQRVWAGGKKESMVDYFPADVTLVPYNRMNLLIILGLAKDVQRVEEFITKHIDVQIERSAPPIFTYRLQYTNATDLQPLLTTIVGYGKSTIAGQYGGVRDGMKFLQPMTIIADKWTNSLVINATPEDYVALKPLIDELDVLQQQVAVEVLIVQVTDSDVKTLGSQLSAPNGFGNVAAGSNSFGPAFLQSVTAQTSGFSNIVVTPPATAGTAEDFSIKSSLGSLLTGLASTTGTTLLTFGKPIWAIFQILKTITSTHVVANPFGVVSNNSTLSLTSGTERRQTSGEVITSSSTGAQITTKGQTPVQATLTVSIRPQINKGNIINLDIDVKNQQFINSLSSDSAGNSPRDLKQVKTQASVVNGETLVLGGIMVESYAAQSVGVPFLENIPLLGWFFKSKTRTVTRDHFMIFICPRLIDPANDNTDVDRYTKYKLHEAQEHISLIDDSDWFASRKDPIQQAFFNSKDSKNLQELHTGTQFAQREAIDGKIDQTQKSPIKKVTQQKKSKRSKKNQNKAIMKEDVIAHENESRRMRNSISGSMQKTQGVPYVA